ncbi:RNA-guided pseudouridylation complex pseudouridine synthase subunit Cbf5 [Candidatus Woesearchaeota archaeon]|nr:RNA-guided pseudouridylation complex pseudouridine synthase subunit Cbf5 [Candidatus Woesearchaeota archaeon]
MNFLDETNILVKKESTTDPNLGHDPFNSPIDFLIKYGMVNINKPQGPTSHQISDYVKQILNVKKAGHGGTLDPNVTGVLPIALENATRIIQIFLKERKEYVALMHLHKEVSNEEIKKIFEEFTGTIKQLPPIRSAVKRQERFRRIYSIDILEIEEKDVLFRMECEAGTYVRKYIHDFGLKLNTGAHMQQLVRIKTGPFNDKNWYSLHDLKDAYEEFKEGNELPLRKIIVPVEFAIINVKKVWVHDSAIDHLCHGSPLYSPGISKLSDNIQKNELVAILTLKNELIALGLSSMDSDLMLKSQRDIAIKLEKVFMPIGTYK